MANSFLFLIGKPSAVSQTAPMQNSVVTWGAGVMGLNLTLTWQENYLGARATLIDGFRPGDVEHPKRIRGDFVASVVSRLDWQIQINDLICAKPRPCSPGRNDLRRRSICIGKNNWEVPNIRVLISTGVADVEGIEGG